MADQTVIVTSPGITPWGIGYYGVGDFSQDSLSLVSIQGSVTTDVQPDAGWGIKGWGIVPWGEEDDVTVVVTGRRLNTFVHPVDTNADGNESVNVDEDDDIVIYLNSVTTSANANVSVQSVIDQSLNSIKQMLMYQFKVLKLI